MNEHTSAAAQITPDGPMVTPVLAVENAAALDALVKVGNTIAGVVTSQKTVADALRGAWLGHALHPLLIEVPMGTWISAATLDVLGGDEQRDASRMLTGVGVLAAVPSALSGWAEYEQAGQRDKRVGVVHAAANGGAVVLQLGSWAARRAGRHDLGRALGLAGMSLAGTAGYLGGHLAAARKVGSRNASFA